MYYECSDEGARTQSIPKSFTRSQPSEEDQRPLRPTHGYDQMKVGERIRAVCSCFCKPGTVRIFLFHPFVVLRQIKRTRPPAQFPVLKGPTRRQTVRAKQAGHFPLFNCPTLK